jgi:hypothetical protein
MRWPAVVILALLLAAGHVLAQTTTTAASAPPGSTLTTPASSPADEVDEHKWSFSLSALTYIVPDDREYVQPTVTLDHDWLHLEARYNYEDIDSGSAWIGYNLSFGKGLTLDVTPMVGGVFGNTVGVAPGYKATLSWWKLELYTEGEYVFNTNSSSDSFFYTWSELTISPVDWFRCGVVIQRTKAYQTEFDIQRGFLVGFVYRNLNFTTYIFNPDDKPVVVLGLGISL